ncbi:MFS transporter [Roseicyclus elongatus]|nr:MFS transporter [Roseibacterium elongatum]
MAQPSTSWPLIGALYLAGLIAAAQFAKVSVTLDALAAAYPGAPVAFAVSGVAVMGVLFGVLAGGVVANLGPRRVILLALAISAVAGAGQAVLPPFPVLMALRVVEGAGHLALVVAIPTLMAGVANDRDRPMVMGLWATFFGVGFSLTAVLAGEAAGPVYGGHALLAGAVAVILWRMLPRGIGGARRAAPGLADHLVIYATPRLFAPALGHGIYAALFLALVTYLPVALGAAWLAAALPLAGLAGSLTAGYLARAILPGHLVPAGFAVMATLFAATWLAGPGMAPAMSVLAMAVSGVVAGAGFAAVPWLNADAPERALANGALAQLGNVGTFSGTPMLAALGVGASLPFAIASAWSEPAPRPWPIAQRSAIRSCARRQIWSRSSSRASRSRRRHRARIWLVSTVRGVKVGFWPSTCATSKPLDAATTWSPWVEIATSDTHIACSRSRSIPTPRRVRPRSIRSSRLPISMTWPCVKGPWVVRSIGLVTSVSVNSSRSVTTARDVPSG